MGENENRDTKNKELTPTDDITIEFVDHDDEIHKVSETAEKIIEEKLQMDTRKEEQDEKLKIAEDKILRLRADFENFKKRTSREWSEKENRAQMEIIRQIIPFLDNIEMALQNVPENVDENWLEGVRISVKDLKTLLKNAGLKEINECGIRFNPAFHESIGFDRVDDYEDGVVAKILQKGYLFKEGLLRPAKVFINKKEAGEGEQER